MSNLSTQKYLMDLVKNSSLQQPIENPDFTLSGQNHSCGDQVTIFIKMDECKQSISQATFQAQGCLLSKAATIIALQDLIGKSLISIASMNAGHITEKLGIAIGPNRQNCVELIIEVLAKITL